MHNKAITKKRKKICLLLGSKSSEDVITVIEIYVIVHHRFVYKWMFDCLSPNEESSIHGIDHYQMHMGILQLIA